MTKENKEMLRRMINNILIKLDYEDLVEVLFNLTSYNECNDSINSLQ